MASRLLGLAVALLVRLGFPLAAASETFPAVPAVPLFGLGCIWTPPHPLGLPGDWTPQTGSEP